MERIMPWNRAGRKGQSRLFLSLPRPTGPCIFESVSRSFALIKENWKVLSIEKENLIFPVLSGVALLLILP